MGKLPNCTIGLLAVAAGSLVVGCATTAVWRAPQLEYGTPVEAIDGLAEGLAIIDRLILWDEQLEDHYISEETAVRIREHLTNYAGLLDGVAVRVNQWKPHDDWARLAANPHVAWPYRLLPGSFSVLRETVFPGRLFPAWSNVFIPTGGGDHYNPWTHTVHLYSSDPTIALHELGHAVDYMQRRYKGTYAFLRAVPIFGYFVSIYQEYQATDHAIDYLIAQGDQEEEMRAYKTLYPALGTYIAWLPGAVVGHVWGRAKAASRKRYGARVGAARPPAGLIAGASATTQPAVEASAEQAQLSTLTSREYREYLEEIYSRIYAHQPAPLSGEAVGEVVLLITVGRSGDLRRIQIVEHRSSAPPQQWKEAIRIAKAAFPLAPFPSAWPEAERQFEIPIRMDISSAATSTAP